MPNQEGSFVRWQGIAIRQLGYVTNLILTFATVSLGFTLTLLKDPRTGRVWLLAVVALLGSIAVGIWCALNRMHDFRETAQIARKREKMEHDWHERMERDRKATQDEIEAHLKDWRTLNRKRGAFTRALFYWQIGTFGAGILFLVATFVRSHIE
jgi:hypothetical protein